ncbi:MAG: class I SAM-dependent methyltransferase [Candidatus Margulisbacteria bacterium]|nr:class I SAM-dependent methyltransferase [Candidatus Margulisiibacteriota bacterium]MBU1021431.1 class I SAM-dependent methyltransferase [Candidatus Margulisiibacteriota bacterium]MBU1728352.1 class I SAM-dependent methyltransferase [Candidatus Margulisiibacteriota bacterium]MBU1955905.1 class I SAM-dependent methyltransferase [Candidatus Margulisiibacteriota bacterium]
MKDLNKIMDSKIFYEDRYEQGYMEEWPENKKNRVYEIIKHLNLPNKGDGLDFGCGNGVFTRVLKQALPNWRIFGCDLSETAINNAKAKSNDCIFISNDEATLINKKFDFIITHHVLEHVFDIENVAKQIAEKTKDSSSMLHIFPCGNTGSFEWQLCNLRIDGINKNMGNRFFFEDEGHIRRMTTESCVLLFSKYGFTLNQAFYSNQYYGAIEWITRSHPGLIFKIFNPLKGKNIKAKLKLSLLLVRFLIVSASRLPIRMYEKFNYRIIKILLYIPSRISIYADKYIIYKAEQEWKKLKTQDNGSEMYLYFTKNKIMRKQNG